MSKYNKILAAVMVVFFFSNADLYLFLADFTPITPKIWIEVLAGLFAPIALYRIYRQDLGSKPFAWLALWSLVFLAISLVWYSVWPSATAIQEVRDRALSCGFMLMAAFILATPEVRRIAAFAAVAVVLATVAINTIQIFQPEWFMMYVPTRSSGLYLNANQCGAALVLGMIAGAAVVPGRLRLPFYLLVGAGVAMTFSRSTITGWVVATGILLAAGSARTRSRHGMIAAAAAVALIIVSVQLATSAGLLDGLALDDNQTDRLSFLSTLDSSDAAARERMDVAGRAWGMFLDRPIAGNGLGSTVDWTENVSTHNMFLTLMVDHGALGALILPALLFCAVRWRPASSPGAHWAFLLFTLLYAMFSHNILTERYFLLAFAFFAAGGVAMAAPAPRTVAPKLRSAAVAPTPATGMVSTI